MYRHNLGTDSAYNVAYDICTACISYLSLSTLPRILSKFCSRFFNKFALALDFIETVITANNPPSLTCSPYTSQCAITRWTRRQFDTFQFFISHSFLFFFAFSFSTNCLNCSLRSHISLRRCFRFRICSTGCIRQLIRFSIVYHPLTTLFIPVIDLAYSRPLTPFPCFPITIGTEIVPYALTIVIDIFTLRC